MFLFLAQYTKRQFCGAARYKKEAETLAAAEACVELLQLGFLQLIEPKVWPPCVRAGESGQPRRAEFVEVLTSSRTMGTGGAMCRTQPQLYEASQPCCAVALLLCVV